MPNCDSQWSCYGSYNNMLIGLAATGTDVNVKAAVINQHCKRVVATR